MTLQDPCCQTCGYSLQGLKDPRCPECGQAFDPAPLRDLQAALDKQRRGLVGLGFLLSLVHLGLLVTAGFATLLASGDDGGSSPPSRTEWFFAGITGLLMQPILGIWQIGLGRYVPDPVEWLLFFANSGVWGFSLAWLVYKLSCRRLQKKSRRVLSASPQRASQE